MAYAKRFNAAGELILSDGTAAAAAIRAGAAPVPQEPAANKPVRGVTVGQALARLFREPRQYLLLRWNWKSAVLSSALRASLFFFVNLSGGWAAARAALLTELAFRGITSGFYGAITETFRDAEPAEAAALTVMVVLPLANHSVEFLVHWMRGTHDLAHSILASMVLTAFSSLFNFYAMRRGTLIVGAGHSSLLSDLRRIPALIRDFVLILPRHFMQEVSRRYPAAPTDGL
jgi:hypothetical protein